MLRYFSTWKKGIQIYYTYFILNKPSQFRHQINKILKLVKNLLKNNVLVYI